MATRSQSVYRWRNDDGSETAATWAAAVDTALAGTLDHNYRIRIGTDLSGIGSITWTPKIQYNKSSAGWNDVNASSSVARTFDSPNYTDNAGTTQQITGGGFNTGRLDDTDGAANSSVTLSDAGNTSTEHEFCLQVRSADVSNGDVIQFRLVTTGGGLYETYGQLGVFTVGTYDKGQFFALFD